MATVVKPGYRTEYTDNYTTDKHTANAGSWNKSSSGLFDGKALGTLRVTYSPDGVQTDSHAISASRQQEASRQRDPAVFSSQNYPSVFRETVIRKDDRGKYLDPFQNIANKPYGRRLMYDPSHPDKMYASQWSSELADHHGCYSFPTTTGLDPEIPFKRDLQWQAEGEVGNWPTDQWKGWTQVACCPPYDGHDDQVEYSQYKVHVP